MKFSKKDLFFSLVTGITTGIIAWRILIFLEAAPPLQIQWSYLVVIVPILWIFGVNLGYFLGRWLSFFNQFGKFAAIGFTNAAVDFGILNFLIALTGIAGGVGYVIFRAAAAFLATLHSYFWNKYWVFQAADTQNVGKEFAGFFGAAVVSSLFNIVIASSIVNFIDPIGGMSKEVWANVGAICGSAAALILNFILLRQKVFKKS